MLPALLAACWQHASASCAACRSHTAALLAASSDFSCRMPRLLRQRVSAAARACSRLLSALLTYACRSSQPCRAYVSSPEHPGEHSIHPPDKSSSTNFPGSPCQSAAISMSSASMPCSKPSVRSCAQKHHRICRLRTASRPPLRISLTVFGCRQKFVDKRMSSAISLSPPAPAGVALKAVEESLAHRRRTLGFQHPGLDKVVFAQLLDLSRLGQDDLPPAPGQGWNSCRLPAARGRDGARTGGYPALERISQPILPK